MTAPLTPEERAKLCADAYISRQHSIDARQFFTRHIAAAVADARNDEREKFKQMLYASDEELADRLIDLMTDKQEPTQ